MSYEFGFAECYEMIAPKDNLCPQANHNTAKPFISHSSPSGDYNLSYKTCSLDTFGEVFLSEDIED